jgi:hypothetical protein
MIHLKGFLESLRVSGEWSAKSKKTFLRGVAEALYMHDKDTSSAVIC